jgi:diguanylate cyclase (GGDEF)-like protein
MLMSATAMAIIAAHFYVIRSMPSKPGLTWWSFACMTQSIAYVFGCMFFDASQSLTGHLASSTFQLSGNLACALGLMLFLGEKVNFKLRFAIYGIACASTVYFILIGQILIATSLVGIYCASNLFQPAAIIFRKMKAVAHYRITAAFLCLMAVHLLVNILVKDVAWLAPIAFLIGTILTISLSLSLAYLALIQFKEHTKESENRAILASITDPLTGLYNRAHLDDLFVKYCDEANQSNGSFAMLYMDLDGFKTVNDTYGHKAGDLILTVVANRLQEWLGAKGDSIRIGGDELIVLNRLRADTTSEHLRYMAQEILTSIEMPITDGKNKYSVSASIGVCSYEKDQNLDDMIQRSDQLMYLAKQSGGKCIYIHNKDVVDTAEVEMSVTAASLVEI